MKRKELSAGCRNVCVACVLLSTLAGCVVVPPGDGADGNGAPDAAAIATVVKHVYGLQGRGRIIFLAADQRTVDSKMLTQAGSAVEADLGVRVLPESAADRSDLLLPALTPVDPETGEIGVSISLERFHLEDDGRLTVSAAATLSGLNAQGYDFVLEWVGDAWIIIDFTETWVA